LIIGEGFGTGGLSPLETGTEGLETNLGLPPELSLGKTETAGFPNGFNVVPKLGLGTLGVEIEDKETGLLALVCPADIDADTAGTGVVTA
jgi:hypothetical protein